jgi:hypothetical protein
MTEPRVLFDYLHLLLIPSTRTSGVFADDFVASQSPLQPWTTLASLIGLTGLLFFSWQTRRRWPVLSAAMLFFLAGHLMESSFIGLELYFEHRNYLPAALCFWPVALCCAKAGKLKVLRRIALVTACCLLAVLTTVQARTWASPFALAQRWAAMNPASSRAQSYAAVMDIEAGHPDDAIRRLGPKFQQHPGNIQYAVTLTDAYCRAGGVPPAILKDTEAALRRNGIKSDLAYQWIVQLLTPGTTKVCAGLPKATLDALALASLTKVPSASEPMSRGKYIQGLIALRRKDCSAALTAFRERLTIQRRPELAQTQIILLAQYCSPGNGLALLNAYVDAAQPADAASSPVLRLRDTLLHNSGYWEDEWSRLRKVMVEDQAQHAKP